MPLEQGIAVLLGGVFNSGILATGATKGAKYNYQDAPPQIVSKVAEIQLSVQLMASRCRPLPAFRARSSGSRKRGARGA